MFSNFVKQYIISHRWRMIIVSHGTLGMNMIFIFKQCYFYFRRVLTLEFKYTTLPGNYKWLDWWSHYINVISFAYFQQKNYIIS
jgi:hypothetical protein